MKHYNTNNPSQAQKSSSFQALHMMFLAESAFSLFVTFKQFMKSMFPHTIVHKCYCANPLPLCKADIQISHTQNLIKQT